MRLFLKIKNEAINEQTPEIIWKCKNCYVSKNKLKINILISENIVKLDIIIIIEVNTEELHIVCVI